MYLLRSQNYSSIGLLKKSAEEFCEVHNRSHRYSTQGGKTPQECRENSIERLNSNYTIFNEKIPLSGGEIHIIRFIRSDLIFNLFGIKFRMVVDAKYEYIKGIIIVGGNRIEFYNDTELLSSAEFILM